MDALADRLMRGPRGRRFLLGLITARDERAWQAVFFASREYLDPAASFTLSWGMEGSAGEAPPHVTASQAADALAELPPSPPDARGLLRALRGTVDDAMYWQPPGREEVLASRPELDDVLARMAHVVAGAPAASWLDESVDPEDQHGVQWPRTERDVGASGTWESFSPAAEVLATWGEAARDEEVTALWERPADPHANWSGAWWSTPPLSLVTTTRALPDDGPVGLHLVEDSYGEEAASTVRMQVPPAVRVLEIACADDWAELCRRHPVDVTASRRHDWFRCTGRHGDWVIPDWERVATEYDGVHLSGAAYLEASGRSIVLDERRASVIAGWNPDATMWLRDIAHPEFPEARWARPQDGDWVRA